MFELMQIIYFFICFIGIFAIGIPCCGLLGHSKKAEAVPYAFLMGCAQIIIVTYWLSYFNIPIKYAAIIIPILGILLWCVAIYGKSVCFKDYINRKSLLLVGICVIAGLMELVPIVIYKAAFPYGDSYTYLCIADWLVDHGYNELIQLDSYKPWLTQMYLYQVQNLRIGAQMLLSFWTALCGQEYSIFLYAAVSGIGVAAFGFAVWMFLLVRGNIGARNIIYAVVFSVFNAPIIIWSAIHGFFPQLFGLVYMIVALAKTISFLRDKKTFVIKDVYETGIFIAVMCLCYSEVVPFFVLAIVAVYFFSGFKEGAWGSNFKCLFILALVSFGLMGEYFIGMVEAILLQFGAVVGNPQTINWMGYIGYWLSSVPIGFNFKLDNYYPSLVRLVFLLLTLVCFILLIIGIGRSTRKTKWEEIQEYGVISIPYLLMLVYFTSFAANPFGDGIGNSWGIYKLVQYYFIIICCYLFSFYADVFRGKKRIGKILVILLPIFFVVSSCVNTINYSYDVTRPMYEYVGKSENPILEYVELAELYKEEKKNINLVNIPDRPRKLLTYFLRDNNLVSNWSTDEYFGVYDAGMDPEYDLNGLTLKYSPMDETSIAGMIPIDVSYVDIQGGSGVGVVEVLEGVGNWTWNDEISDYTIYNNTQQDNVTVAFEASCADSNEVNVLDIYVDDKLMLSENLNALEKKSIKIDISVEAGDYVNMRLEYSGKTMLETPNGRELCVCIWNIGANAQAEK